MRENWREVYKDKLCSPAQAAGLVKDKDRVYIGTASNVAYVLADALAERADELKDVVITSGLVGRESKIFTVPHFYHNAYFMGAQERVRQKVGNFDYTSVHLSQFDIWAQEVARPNVLFLEVSEPDKGGYVNLSTNGALLIWYMLENAETVVFQVNRNICHVCGEGTKLHISNATAIVEADDSQHALPEPEMMESLKGLANNIVEQIPDGATIQLGAGRVASAIGYGLFDRNDLGIHTEMFSDSLMQLMKNGNVTNKKKTYYPGKTVVGFAWGTQEMYDYIDYNDDFCFLPMKKVNNPFNIAKNDNFMSVNGAVAIDLLGQVSAESVNGQQYSAIGGQVDYVRGAQLSKGGKSFLVMESTYGNVDAGKGGSKIMAQLPQGTVVTTSRADVQYVATEYGCVNLKVLSMRDRVKAMISLAHPAFRAQLTEDAKRLNYL